MTAPLDHVVPDGRTIDVGVIRVSAADPARREGAIFLNTGGPGGHPGKVLSSIAGSWTSSRASEPSEIDKRHLAERYDLIAVIPRGLVGSGVIRCLTGLPPRFAFLPSNLDDENWRLVAEEAQARVDACKAIPSATYINTEQHVHDMDMLRVALGDERIHFYGISYGGMVGAWYASIYPSHIGRMLLDSSMDFTRDHRMAVRSTLAARHRVFVEDALTPLLENPTRYGLGDDPGAVTQAVQSLPSRIREILAGWMDSPLQLAATLHVAKYLRVQGSDSLVVISSLLQRVLTPFDLSLDRRLRQESLRIAAMVYDTETKPVFFDTAEGDSVRTILPCNVQRHR